MRTANKRLPDSRNAAAETSNTICRETLRTLVQTAQTGYNMEKIPCGAVPPGNRTEEQHEVYSGSYYRQR